MKNISTPIKIILTLSAIAFGSAATAKEALPGVKVIEAEDMTLSSAAVEDSADASNGKAVKMLSEDAVASISVNLPKGRYVMNMILQAHSFETDGVYMSADQKVKRTSTVHFHNEWVYGNKFLIFVSDGENPVELKVISKTPKGELAEFGMLIDRLEIAEFGASADVLDHWTGYNF
jgi:hypothetical protein